MIKILEPYFLFEDERGFLKGLINFGNWHEINLIYSQANSIRGNHYHKETEEIFIILEGKIKVTLPPLSQERRIEIIKIIKQEAEKRKITLRILRDEFNKKINNQFENKEISEDQKFKLKEKVQKIVDDANKEIENLSENKIREISA